MGRNIPEGLEYAFDKLNEAHKIEKHEKRRKVVSMASRMIDALKGKAPDAQPQHSHLVPELSSAPDEVPAIEWRVVEVGGQELDDFKVTIGGNIGEYYAHVFHNEQPSATFNSGFYAGVLAVRDGLVDVNSFHHDGDSKQSPAAGQ